MLRCLATNEDEIQREDMGLPRALHTFGVSGEEHGTYKKTLGYIQQTLSIPSLFESSINCAKAILQHGGHS